MFSQQKTRLAKSQTGSLIVSPENKMVEAARIAWAAILIKSRQLISFDGAGSGFLWRAPSTTNGHEWTHDGPQMGHSFHLNFGVVC